MSQQRPPSASSLLPTSLFDSIKTYLLNIDVSAYTEYERELRKLDGELPEFEFGNSTPSLPTPSLTDCESSDSESDLDNAPGRKVLNLTPRNKTLDYSVLDDFFDSEHSPLYHQSQMTNKNENNVSKTHSTPPEDKTAPSNTRKYSVTDNESLNTIALKFNISPNMLKQINALSTEIIFPGQRLLVPLQTAQREAIETVLHPVASKPVTMPPKKQIHKYPMKRITRFDGSVCGTTLLTSNALMFRAHVNDNLVIQHGQSTYNASIPLDSISEILMFESFEQMLDNIQSTAGMQDACTKCAELKHQLCHHGSPETSADEVDAMETSVDPPTSESPRVKIIDPNRDFDDAYAGSATPESNIMDAAALSYSGELELGHSPKSPIYSPTCKHEFEGYAYGQVYSTKNRVNPFNLMDEKNKLIIPNYRSSLDPLDTMEGRMHRVDSDTSLATKAFFKKIDENTNQMQSMLENANKHEFSIFISIHAICCSRTHGNPSFQIETEEGYKKAHFWVCVSEQDVAKIMDNFFMMCPQLNPVDDSTNCLMRCVEDYYTQLNDVILPDRKPQFVPREVDKDLMCEPFSGNLNYSPGNPIFLTTEMMGELQPYLPCHIIGIDMLLVYSMRVHGMTLKSLYTQCKNYMEAPCILLIKDTKNYVFGAYLSHGIIESPKYYGSGETFLFRLSPDPQCYFWQGENHYFMMGRSDYFTVGAGDGQFALYMDEMLQKGTSNRSLTFYNDTLSSSPSFDILNVEVWCFTDETVPSDTDSLSSDRSRYSGQYRGNFYMS